MIRRKSFIFLVPLILGLIAVIMFVEPAGFGASAEKQVWISIDEQELATVQRELGESASKFDIDVVTVNAGIAIVRLNSSGLADLSIQMHESFDKCSGYILHESQEEAYLSVERMLSVDTNERFGNYTIDNQATVNQLIPETLEPQIRQTILDLSSYHTRRHDQPTGLDSANYVNFRWGTYAAAREDISVEFFDNSAAGSPSPQPSVILTIAGTTFPDEVVVLGAHQDSIRSGMVTGAAPGADDDASGIASITEAIRVIVEKDFRPERTLKFMAYAAEEVGLRGSKNIAEQYNANNVNVVGVLQLDMTNYKGNAGVDIGLITDFTNAAQNQFVRDLVAEYLPTLTTQDSQCNYGCSDHASWTANGFPASFPFEATFGTHNSALHTANDTISQSGNNANHAEKFSKLALAFAGELAKGSIVNAPANTKFDFDGDSKTDVSIFRPAPGEWWYLRSSDGGNFAAQFGAQTDKIVPADFTGDGRADIAFFRPATSEWFILRSEDQSFYSFPFGGTGDIPVPGDFDGDGASDPAVFRPGTAEWFILRSSDGGTTITTFGQTGDRPTVADFDGDGSDDVAIYRPSVSEWWQLRSTQGVVALQFGSPNDQTVPADYTGDGKADIAFWRPSNGNWFILRSEDNSYYSFPFGGNGDIPAPGDYDGDGTADPTVFRPSNNTWFKNQSTSGFEAITFGASGDIAVPSAFIEE